MKIFALLTVLLFLALQAQTEPFEERADQVPGQDQPGAEVQNMTISFAGDEPSTRNATGLQGTTACPCRVISCSVTERHSRTCAGKKFRNRLCCRRRPGGSRPTAAQHSI